MRKVILSVTLAVAATATQAESPNLSATVLGEASRATQIEDMATIPVQSLRAIESEGQIHYVSQNGRYVLTGQLIDVLQRKSLDTMGEIRDSVNNLSFDRLGMDIDTLNTVTIGQGPTRVVAFIDPLCKVCLQLMKDAQQLVDEYTFKFIVVPALGDKSNKLASRIQCVQRPEQVVPAMIAGKLGQLPIKPDCTAHGYEMTLLLADLMGVNGVPFVIAPNGEIGRGRPTHLQDWLKERAS